MRVVVIYDISDNRKRGRLHCFLSQLGVNSQKSVFECDISAEQLQEIRDYVQGMLDVAEDRFRIYRLCSHCCSKVLVQGQGVRLMSGAYRII